MATNNFSTILRKNTQKLTLILLYTFLEWILIFFLLLNSIFAYSIAKFANYFQLKPPCLLCCRLGDHISDPTCNTTVKKKSSYTELVCENHAAEISGLSFCTNHRKLAETESMCTDCFASKPSHIDSFVSWDIGVEKVGNGDTGSRFCSCCDEKLTRRHYPGFSLLKTSSGSSDCTRTGSLIIEEMEEEVMKIRESEHEVEGTYEINGQKHHGQLSDDSLQVITQFQKDSITCSCDRLIPLELIDFSLKTNNLPSDSSVEKQDLENGDDISSPENKMHCPATIGTHQMEESSKDEDVTNREVKTHHFESNETEDEKYPETPIENLDCLRKKLPPFENSLDGSMVNELECNDQVQIIEHLKSALTSERKTLAALYAELEEERSASAVATNQTMAMITRLQEEKAAMRMEALQYQRMMDEQSEYDQEALQLLNELMVKREKEKQELEIELDVYRKKVLDYEAKEELSIDSNHDAGSTDDASTMALDCVKQMSSLDGSIVEYEEERQSILNQLNALEEKLLELGDNAESVDQSSEQHCISNEFSVMYPESKTMSSMARNLLPFLDAVDSDNDEKSEEQSIERLFPNINVDSKKVAFVEEVDHVYERLRALEVDREFLNHCVGSITKGDKGMDLLQEVLQHLRDLKSVELRVEKT